MSGARSLVLVHSWRDRGGTNRYAIWLALVVAASAIAIAAFYRSRSGIPGWAFSLGLVPVVLVCLYGGIAYYVNSTVITRRGDTLFVRHGPMPWWGNLAIPISSIEQVYCEEYVVETSRGREEGHRVMVYVRGRERPHILVNEIMLPSDALDLERRLEERLGLIDFPIDGELRARPGRRLRPKP